MINIWSQTAHTRISTNNNIIDNEIKNSYYAWRFDLIAYDWIYNKTSGFVQRINMSLKIIFIKNYESCEIFGPHKYNTAT